MREKAVQHLEATLEVGDMEAAYSEVDDRVVAFERGSRFIVGGDIGHNRVDVRVIVDIEIREFVLVPVTQWD